MRRLHHATTIGVAVASLALPVLVGTAGAADDPAHHPARKRPVQGARTSGPPSHAAATVSCGQTITRSTTLIADVGPCSGDGIVIGADNIRLNLNGHQVLGNFDLGAGGDFAGIRLPDRTGVLVTGHPGKSGKRGIVAGFEAGVVIDGGSRNTVENVVVQDNVGSPDLGVAELGDGIVAFSSANNLIVDNIVQRNGFFDGIGILGPGSDSNTIRRNTVAETLATGRNPFGAEGAGIVMSSALDGPPRVPLRNNNVMDNIVVKNAGAGINSIVCVRCLVTGNSANENGFGILGLANGNGILVQGLFGSVTENLVQGNQANSNAGSGIRVDQAFRNRIVGNEALNNGLTDLRDQSSRREDCDQNVWLDNVFGTAFPRCAAGSAGSGGSPGGGGGIIIVNP